MNIERRRTRELRAKDSDKADTVGTLEGYAAVFNSRSEDLGGFFEEIAPGAFDGVLDDDVRALIDHDSGRVLGRSSAGTLRLSTDDVGLRYEVDLPDTQEARDLLTLIKRGDVRESSFGFSVASRGDEWDENEDGQIIRTIRKVGRLYDVSPVAFPAYPAATVAMRSLVHRARQSEPAGPSLLEINAQIDAMAQRLQRAETRLEHHTLRLRLLRS